MINKAILVGHVGTSPNIKEFQDGGKVAQFTFATKEPAFKTSDGREIPERTEWHNIVVRGGLVKIVENYVGIGQQLYIEGKIRTRAYEQDGVKKYITEIICDVLKMLGRKPASNTSSQADDQHTERQTQSFAQDQTEHQEDDLPF